MFDGLCFFGLQTQKNTKKDNQNKTKENKNKKNNNKHTKAIEVVEWEIQILMTGHNT